MSIFSGSGVAIVTPMYEDGSINFDVFGELIDFQINEGTDCIVVCGTTGESATMTHDEHIECARFVVDKVAHRIPVIVGTGSNCTREAIQLSKDASKLGADGLLCVTPYYNKCTQEGLVDYFVDIAQATDLPIIMYSVVSRTGCNITPYVANKAYRSAENIVAIKEASGDIGQVARIAQLTEGGLDIYSGNDEMITPIMSLGGKGIISVLANVMPKLVHEVASSFLDGKTKKSAELQIESMELVDALFCEVNPIPVKEALHLMGFDVGPLRKPLTRIEAKHKEQLITAMKKWRLI